MTLADVGFFVVLVLAVASGWWLGRRSGHRARAAAYDLTNLYHEYFVGLNYLLRDEPDEAIDTFIRALEINGETIETHLALGTLLRRRGKVDKAIKVHQTLLARDGLEPAFADSVQLELANDYIAAGLLDRAEGLLRSLLEAGGACHLDALYQLTTLYQTEKEWEQAIQCVERLLADRHWRQHAYLPSMAAHFCCERADRALESDDIELAQTQIQRALGFNPRSVRALLLATRVEQQRGQPAKAIRELERIRTQQPRFLSEIIEPMAACYEQLGDAAAFDRFLRECLGHEPRASVELALSRLIQAAEGDAAALEFLAAAVARHPTLRGTTSVLTQLAGRTGGRLGDDLGQVAGRLEAWMAGQPAYQCDDCGFETRNLYWQCPSCQKWDTVMPILGVRGE